MKKKNVAPKGARSRTNEPSEITEQALDRVTGAMSDNPIYSGGSGGAQNPLFEAASAATNPLYTP